MDVTLGGLQAYVEDIWDRLPKDLTALAGDNVASLENDFLGEIGYYIASSHGRYTTDAPQRVLRS
jgi:hypothetical protein